MQINIHCDDEVSIGQFDMTIKTRHKGIRLGRILSGEDLTLTSDFGNQIQVFIQLTPQDVIDIYNDIKEFVPQKDVFGLGRGKAKS